jgi:UDP-GlcNAc3NAcA epimerase
MRKKIITVLGARPQFIKASVVSQAILKASDRLTEVVVHTGQHFDSNMSDVFFSEFGMCPPSYQLGIHGGGHGEMTGRMLAAVEEVLLAEKPDAVMVYGDTNSTLAGALAAVKLHIPLAHVEAGLRSFNMRMPEEVNRIVADRVSQWLFAPTNMAVENLRAEGVAADRIICVGDVMYDAALLHASSADAAGGQLSELGLSGVPFALVTVHRAENTDVIDRLGVICAALARVAEQLKVVWPLHPRTRVVLEREGLWESLAEKVTFIEPLGYLSMVQLEKHAAVIATDSGGVQKEAFFHRIPCVTLRDETEWTELVAANWNRLVPPRNACELAAEILNAVGRRGENIAPYGNGNAAGLIVQTLLGALT